MENMATLGGALLIYYFGADPVCLVEMLRRTLAGTQVEPGKQVCDWTERSGGELSSPRLAQ
jgi:hypothetical protein